MARDVKPNWPVIGVCVGMLLFWAIATIGLFSMLCDKPHQTRVEELKR